jgi:hypothetical protein
LPFEKKSKKRSVRPPVPWRKLLWAAPCPILLAPAPWGDCVVKIGIFQNFQIFLKIITFGANEAGR